MNRLPKCSFLVLALVSSVLGQDSGLQSLRVEETEKTVSIFASNGSLLIYNIVSPPVPDGIDQIYQRSGFLHPVYAPNRQEVTATFPVDHAHQHGIFSAWVKTKYADKEVDFWNLAGRTGLVEHERVVSTFQEKSKAGFEVDILHRVTTSPATDVLRERWKVTAYPTDLSYYCFDLETIQRAITDRPLVIEEYHYGGVAVRGPTHWLLPNDGYRKAHQDIPVESFSFLNSLGQDRIAGNHARAKWIVMTGTSKGQTTTTAVLDHPSNFRSPQAARLHPTKPYFCFAPCVGGEFVIDTATPYRARYRFITTSASPDARWLDQQWDQWSRE